MKIHGKEYMEVNTRLQIFRKDFPDYSLESEWIRIDEQVAFCRAIVRNASDRLIATGTAFEEIASSGVNSTSHVENCETSAWGRALGNLGIGLDTAVCSAEEVTQAIERQEKTVTKTAPIPPPKPKSDFLKEVAKLSGKVKLLDFETLVKNYGVKHYSKITDHETQKTFYLELKNLVKMVEAK